MNVNDTMVSKPKLCKMTTLSYPTIWRRIKAGRFPKPYPLSKNRVAWKLSEVQAWIEEQGNNVM